MKNELNVDSECLSDTISTLHEGRKYHLRQSVQRMIDYLYTEELNSVRWIHRFANPADAVTKYNEIKFLLVNGIPFRNFLVRPKHFSLVSDTSEWK